MIHAYLFLFTENPNRTDRDDHGAEFQQHMHRINKEAGTRITVSTQSFYFFFLFQFDRFEIERFSKKGLIEETATPKRMEKEDRIIKSQPFCERTLSV
jgi:SprT-like family.